MRSDNLRTAPRWITPELVGRILALAMPVGGEPAPVEQVPTRGVKPKLAIVESKKPNPPVTHSRRAKESEAAPSGPTSAASPRRCWDYNNERRAAELAAVLEAERPLYQIAFDRGIAVADLARTLGQPHPRVTDHAKRAGFAFGRRPPLAVPLTIEQLLALADPTIPLPELRSVRLLRVRREHEARVKREGRAEDVARRRAERAQAAELRRRRAEEEKAEARRRREIERADRRAAAAPAKSKVIREAKPAAICRPARPAPSREPAVPAVKQPRAHPVQAEEPDRLNGRRRSAAVMRGQTQRAQALLDAGKTTAVDLGTKFAMRTLIQSREQEARLSCPVEQAKTVLRGRYAPVCSMAVHDGDSNLFQVGHRKNVTREELLRMAARFAA